MPTTAASGLSVDSDNCLANSIWAEVSTGCASSTSSTGFVSGTDGSAINSTTTPWTVCFPNGTVTKAPIPNRPFNSDGK